jgi:hypothetical protein
VVVVPLRVVLVVWRVELELVLLVVEVVDSQTTSPAESSEQSAFLQQLLYSLRSRRWTSLRGRSPSGEHVFCSISQIELRHTWRHVAIAQRSFTQRSLHFA